MDYRASNVLLLIFILGNTLAWDGCGLFKVGGAETSAFTKLLSASVEGQSSTSQLRSGAARTLNAHYSFKILFIKRTDLFIYLPYTSDAISLAI